MTAEIAIMNHNGIALASDSAVTIQTKNGKKIYNTGNKLFMLSKYEPIGIMIYGRAKFMGVPWEIIIKLFREKVLSYEKFSTLEEYAEKFISFLIDDDMIIPLKKQQESFLLDIESYLRMINTKIEKNVKEKMGNSKQIEESKIKRISEDVIDEYNNGWQKRKLIGNISKEGKNRLIKDFEEKIFGKINEVFERLPISEEYNNKLLNLSINIYLKINSKPESSGIVIAGYGEEEIFPSLVAYTIYSKVNKILKYNKEKNTKISFDIIASISPFAQSEMVHTFIEGIDKDQKLIIDNYLRQMFLVDYPERICDKFNGIGKDNIKDLRLLGKLLIDEFNEKMELYRDEKHVTKVSNSVSFLPKDELAEMAESLVQLTSFKRRVSMDDETVGGPIDVAIITKGDGFIWMKRKHYFSKEYNRHFFENYFTKKGEE